MSQAKNTLLEVLSQDREALLAGWLSDLRSSGIKRDDLMRESELKEQCAEILSLMESAVASANGNVTNIQGREFSELREMLARISRTRAEQGFTPRDTATFVFALKRSLFERITARSGVAADDIWKANLLIDSLGMFTVEAFTRTREEMIARQQQELLELSTPVVKLWDGILALPMIGTLDSARTQIVMEALLQKIVETGSEIAILDITGVPTVDTLVAQHLLKTVAAARLMGAECIISGIRPQIAQTIVHLGVDLKDVVTKATLADAFRVALETTGSKIHSRNGLLDQNRE